MCAESCWIFARMAGIWTPNCQKSQRNCLKWQKKLFGECGIRSEDPWLAKPKPYLCTTELTYQISSFSWEVSSWLYFDASSLTEGFWFKKFLILQYFLIPLLKLIFIYIYKVYMLDSNTPHCQKLPKIKFNLKCPYEQCQSQSRCIYLYLVIECLESHSGPWICIPLSTTVELCYKLKKSQNCKSP